MFLIFCFKKIFCAISENTFIYLIVYSNKEMLFETIIKHYETKTDLGHHVLSFDGFINYIINEEENLKFNYHWQTIRIGLLKK